LCVILASCSGDDGKSTGRFDTASATDTGPTTGLGFGPEDVDITLSSAGVTIEIRESAEPFSLGIAPDCDPEAPSCWIAESCVEEQSGYEFCHGLSVTGATLNKVATPGEVVSGASTLFDNSFTDGLGYALIAANGDCYTWGENKDYYISALGCTSW
jgi:hypothetical protein